MRWSARHVTLAAVVVLSVVGLAVAIWIACYPDPEPTFKGRKLSLWVEALGASPATTEARESCEQAIRQIGTNAVPYLVKWIQYDPSPLFFKGKRLFDHISGPIFGWMLPDRLNARAGGAILAFRCFPSQREGAIGELTHLMLDPENIAAAGRAAYVLSEAGPPAIPSIMRGLTNSNPQIRTVALIAFQRIARSLPDEAETGITALLKCLSDTNENVASIAASALGALRRQPDVSVPALINVLAGTNTVVKLYATSALGQFATDARAAIPILSRLLQHSDENAREAATNALWRISPDRLPPEIAKFFSNAPPAGRRGIFTIP